MGVPMLKSTFFNMDIPKHTFPLTKSRGFFIYFAIRLGPCPLCPCMSNSNCLFANDCKEKKAATICAIAIGKKGNNKVS